MSGAVSAQYDAWCPTCNADPHTPCRTKVTRRVTDTHVARIDRWHVVHGLLTAAPLSPAVETTSDEAGR